MTTILPWTVLIPLVLLSISSLVLSTDKDSPAPDKGVTFSHRYKIDIPGSSSCKLEPLPLQDEAGQQAGRQGDNDIIFRHNIRLQTPKCDCEESETFKSLLYRVNGLEEEVNYLKTQCAQGCWGKSGVAGVDTSCSDHGTYQHETCSCVCNPGWEGPDCSVSSCPDECNDNGRCVDGKCVCHQGYTGHDCSQALCPDNCNDKGHCVDGKCVCFAHFSGEDCSIPRCPNDCIGNGVCVDGRCVCEQGFHGEDCSLVLSPQGLQLVQATDVSLLVDWEPVHMAEHYLLTYHPKHQKNALKQVQVPNTDNTYLITQLTPGVTYVIQVQAVVREIRSETETIEAATEDSALDSIRILGQTEGSIQVEWENPPTDLDHFLLKHVDPSGQQEELNVQRSQEAQTKHTIVGLNPGTEYLISVQAIKGSMESKAASVTGATDIDAPPSLVTTEVTEDTITVSWDQVQSEIEGYMLNYLTPGGSSLDIPIGRDQTSYMLIGLKPGVLHTIYLWAFNGDRTSRKSSTEAETDIDGPKDLRARDVSTDSATLTWTRPLADIDGYILSYRDEESAEKTVEKQISAVETSFQLSGLQSGKKYEVTIVAYRGSKSSREVTTMFRTVGLQFRFPTDCTQIMKNGVQKSGVYTIYIKNERSKPAEVFCDMDTDGGGWLVLQRRNSGRLDFMKRWRQYIAGFGDLTDEFWFGLEKLHELTNTPTRYELRFDLGLGSERAYAVYDNFRVASAKHKFKLTIGNYSGTAGDAMTYHQGRPWTTVDNDNDIALGNCALTHRGAWWYKNCHLANPNGKWGDNRHSLGVNWEPWKGHLMSLDFTEMKIRPVGTMASRKRRTLMRQRK